MISFITFHHVRKLREFLIEVSSCSIVCEHFKWIAKTDWRAQHAGATDLNFNESISDRRVHPRYELHNKRIHYLYAISRIVGSSETNRSRARWRGFAASLAMVARLCWDTTLAVEVSAYPILRLSRFNQKGRRT